MTKIGPFTAKFRADEQNDVWVEIYHPWDEFPIARWCTNTNITECGWNGIHEWALKRELMSWLDAGDRHLFLDLIGVHDGIVIKTVKAGNKTSGRVNLPKDWEGGRVAIIKLDTK